MNTDLNQHKLTGCLDADTALIKGFFENDDTFRMREIVNSPYFHGYIFFLDGMVNALAINQSIIAPLLNKSLGRGGELADRLAGEVISSNELKKTGSVKEMVDGILYGDTVLLLDGCAEGLVINSKGFDTRGISEPDDDKTLLGPREGFTEALMTNTSLLRRKLQTPQLKFKFRSFGAHSGTKACLCYLEGLADTKILKELEKRLDEIAVDSALGSNYIVERIKDHPYSLFKTIGECEKPDIVAAKLLEGRIAIMLDGTPVVLTLPYLFVESLQSPDDYYLNFYYGSFGRLLRILGLFLSLSLPALYLSVLCFHPEMIPAGLMLNMSAALKGTPFPLIAEILAMLLVFEILRETGVRMSNKIGGALSFVGALVLGQSAVEARLVSAPTIIAVAMTCVAALMLPRLKGAIIILRIAYLLAASVLGLTGYFMCLIATAVYLSSMKSFVCDYMSGLFGRKARDGVTRVPFGKAVPFRMVQKE